MTLAWRVRKVGDFIPGLGQVKDWDKCHLFCFPV